MGSCAAPSAKGDDKFITTDYLQQCRKGYITRRYQCFPLAPLPEDRKYDSLPDLVLHPEQETIKCKEKHYSQPL
ncbi:hypothetical protein F8B92_23290 [Escherichia coli]|nr:hypothetical protein [Escherichia coli]MDU9497748.1 hypothetical protein [Escherichia coli]